MNWFGLVEWEDVRKDNKYPADDNNNGYIYGIEWYDGEEIVEITWYKTVEERLLGLLYDGDDEE